MVKVKTWTNEIVNTPIKKIKVRDYHYLFSKWISKEFREKNNIWDIWINWAVCLLCKDYIRSKNWHNFVTCSCWNVSVDWGSWYNRRAFKDKDSYIDIIELFDNI